MGYLTATYAQVDDPENLFTRTLSQVTARDGFRAATSSSRSTRSAPGRSMYDLRWYQALALWKSAVFLEGNYKRFVQGASDDEFYRLMEHGIPELARAALEVIKQPAPGT